MVWTGIKFGPWFVAAQRDGGLRMDAQRGSHGGSPSRRGLDSGWVGQCGLGRDEVRLRALWLPCERLISAVRPAGLTRRFALPVALDFGWHIGRGLDGDETRARGPSPACA